MAAGPMKQPVQVPDIFAFHPRWWWDPPPPWLGGVIEHLRPEVIREIAVIQIELEKAVLEAQIRAADKTMAALKR